MTEVGYWLNWWPTPVILGAIIIFYAFLRYNKGRKELAALDDSLKTLSQRLLKFQRNPSEFSEQVEALRDKFGSDPYIGHAWVGYIDSLDYDEQTRRLKSGLPAGEFFNERIFRHGRINLRSFEAIPNQLVGIGLLITFVGLVLALFFAKSGIGASPDEANKALTALLGTAATKFLTSVAALASSLVFAHFKNKRLHETELLIEQVSFRLEQLITPVTLERLTEFSNQELVRQTAQLERFNQDLAVSIATALDEKIGKTMTVAVQPLIEAIEAMAKNLSALNQEALKEMAEKFAGELSGAAQEHTRQIGAMLEKAAEAIGKLPGQIDEASERFQASIVAGGEELETSFAAAGDNLDARMAQSGEILSTALGGAAQRIEQSAEALDRTASRSAALSEQFDATLEAARSITASLGVLVTQVESAGGSAETLGKLADTMTRVAEKLEGAATSVEAVSNQTERLNDRSTELVDKLVGRVDVVTRDLTSLNNAISNSMQKLSDGLASFAEGTTGFVRSVDKELADAVGRLSAAVQQLDEVLEEMPKRGDFSALATAISSVTASRPSL